MKIGILIDRHNVGGVEKIAIEQVRALRSLGEDAYLVLLTRNALVKDAFKDLTKGIPMVFLDDKLPRFLRFSFKFPVFHFFSFFHISYPFLIPWVVKKNEFEYLISHGTFTTFTAVAIRLIKGIKYSPIIWDPIGYIVGRVYKHSFNALVHALLLKLAFALDALVVWWADGVIVGGSVHNEYIQSLRSDLKITVVTPAVHPATTIHTAKKPYILMVTAWKKGKNPEYVLEIAKQLPKITIKMVGKWLDPTYQQQFLQDVQRAQLTKVIEVLGSVSEQKLRAYYSEALLFLQTNDDRGFGMPALEAASHGTTFIIPKDQGVCELFKNGEDGFFTTELDTAKIVQHIRTLFKKPALAKSMGKSAYNRVARQHSWEAHAKRIIQVVQEGIHA